MWIGRIIGFTLCLASIDAFVATAHGALAAVLAVGIAAVLTAGTVVVFWNRAPVAAAACLLWLASAFAIAAFFLGSADESGAITFTGLTPGDAAAIVVSVALAAAGAFAIAMVRNMAFRIIAAFVTLYALVPLPFSVGHGGLHAALSGGILSRFRGAYVGIEALLPLAGLAALVAACVFLTRRRGVAAATAFFLACAMVATNQLGSYSVAQAGLPSLLAFHQTGGSEASEEVPISTESPEETAAVLGDDAASMPPEQYDLQTRAKSLTTLDAAFTYVRDSIGFETYSGVLRAARGTFETGAGNAIDRAMLLAYLLDAQHIPVRYATGHLAAAQAEVLYARIFETKTSPAPAQPLASFGPADALGHAIFARADHDVALMNDALGNDPRDAKMTTHDDALKEIASHAWLQAQVNGQWIDLDTSFPDATPGRAYAVAEQTATELPAALVQHVTIRVTTETLENGALEPHVALEQTFPAYTLLDRQVFLAHVPFSGASALLRSKGTFRPLLVVDGQEYSGDEISYTAGTPAASAASRGADGTTAAGSSGTTLDDAIGALRAEAPSEPATPASQFVAERLDFVVDSPDGQSDSTSRMLADRASTAWRHAGKFDAAQLQALPRNKDGLIATQAIYNFCFSAGKHDVPAYALAMQAILRGHLIRSESGPNEEPTFNEQAWPLAMSDFSYFILSDHVIVPALNDTPGLRFYADSPRIFIFSFAPDPGGDATTAFVTTDLRRDRLRAVARDETAQASVAQHKLRFAALEGALEDQLGRASLPPADDPGVSTSSLAATGGVDVFRPDANLAAVRDPETAARMQVALADGSTLIVPHRVLAGGISGWWEVSKTGDARAVLDDDVNGFEVKPKSSGNGLSRGAPVSEVDPATGRGVSTKLPGEPVKPPKSKSGSGGGEFGEYEQVVEAIAAVVASPFFKLFVAVAGVVGAGTAIALAMRH